MPHKGGMNNTAATWTVAELDDVIEKLTAACARMRSGNIPAAARAHAYTMRAEFAHALGPIRTASTDAADLVSAVSEELEETPKNSPDFRGLVAELNAAKARAVRLAKVVADTEWMIAEMANY